MSGKIGFRKYEVQVELDLEDPRDELVSHAVDELMLERKMSEADAVLCLLMDGAKLLLGVRGSGSEAQTHLGTQSEGG